ncbi:MAG: polysaccharide biosynthesis/export protein [Acetobacteraceae bacterium]|jgi:polysaccharide export outer membrane protein|nr:polysaccharide biosynthesis/export protein [Acetobacteraceae bacterium]
MRFFRHTSRMLTGSSWSVLLVAALVLIPRVALSDYRLQPGDIIDVSLTGAPDFKEHAPIGVEGEVGLPLSGQIKVRGLSLSEARAKIAGELANKLYRQYTNDGREISHLIVGNEVVVTVSEYTPVFVNGDVTKPGAYPFRPGMTVRQAIAVAGGFDLIRSQGPDPVMQTAELQAEYQTLWLQVAGEQARSWRLRTELRDKSIVGADNTVPNPGGVAADFMKGEAEQLKAVTVDRESSKALLQEAIKKATLQLAILAEKKTKDEEGSQADLADFKTVRDLFQKGLAQITRLSEARRASLLSSEQLLQTLVESSNVERQRDEYARQLEKIDTQTRIDDLQELQRTNLHLAELTARLKSTSDRLLHVNLLRSQVAQGGSRAVDIGVYRKAEGGPGRIDADEDLELTPGDVVEVALQSRTVTSAIATSANVR